MIRHPLAAALSLVTLTAFAAAHAQTLYRYTDPDGRVVYTDKAPPASATNVQPKKMQENVIEADSMSYAARQAAEHFPVTLYTFDCNICKEAQALLAKRGVPFQTVIVTDEAGAARLKALTGKQKAPTLQVGDKLVMVGYNEDRWGEMLDEAGYPRTPPPARGPAPKAATASAAPAPEPAPTARGHDYPQD